MLGFLFPDFNYSLKQRFGERVQLGWQFTGLLKQKSFESIEAFSSRYIKSMGEW